MSASFEFPVHESSQVGQARRTAVQLAEQFGCDEVSRGHVAIVVNELATNLVKHARDGSLIFSETGISTHNGIEIVSIDRGPGIADVEKCLCDGYSTAGSPGTGLGAVRRLAAEWDIYSQPGAGTVQVARVGCEPFAAQGLRVSGLSVATPGETECGDKWAADCDDPRCRIMLADGLGHGDAAAEAAQQAVEALGERPLSGPTEVLAAAHQRMRTTRGAAVALCEFDLSGRTLRYAGVGNIVAFIAIDGRTQNLVSVNGTLGAQLPRLREFNYDLPPEAVVVMHSDGLSSHVRLGGYRGLGSHDPAVIAGVLYRDFKRGRDDATVVVAALR
jgi:anti-sigma regulatory factor (Ser/Thr protein kinase)